MRFILAKLLSLLVARNYRARIAGKLPDEWYWADLWLVRLGYATNEYGQLLKWQKSHRHWTQTIDWGKRWFPDTMSNKDRDG